MGFASLQQGLLICHVASAHDRAKSTEDWASQEELPLQLDLVYGRAEFSVSSQLVCAIPISMDI